MSKATLQHEMAGPQQRGLHLSWPNPLSPPHVVITPQEQRHGDQRYVAIAADTKIGPHSGHVQAGQRALVGCCCLQSTGTSPDAQKVLQDLRHMTKGSEGSHRQGLGTVSTSPQADKDSINKRGGCGF